MSHSLYPVEDKVHTLLSRPFDDEIHTTAAEISRFQSDPSLFNPKAVSIGPQHAEDDCVQASIEWKRSFLAKLLSRIDAPKDEILESCMRKVWDSISKIKAYYGWTEDDNDDRLAEMMVIDACFILELMLKISEEKQYPPRLLLVDTVLHDLVLIENQIPFFVLDDIFQCTVLRFKPHTSLIDHLFPVLASNNLFHADINNKNLSTTTTPHILGLLHQCYKPPVENVTLTLPDTSVRLDLVLDIARLHFKPNKETPWVMDMEVNVPFFRSWSTPSIRMPVLSVDEHTESVFRNLIAYEQVCATNHDYIKSYAYAMSMLANAKENVSVLVKSRVLVNNLGSDEMVATLFKNFHDFRPEKFFYEEQLAKLEQYYCSTSLSGNFYDTCRYFSQVVVKGFSYR